MANAIAECIAAKEQGREYGIRRAARAYGVPRSTLERRVNGKVAGSKHSSGRPTAFSEQEESELVDLLTTMARRGFPLREREVRSLATDYATKNGLLVFAQNKTQNAGYFWMQGFLRRHPELKVKRAEGLSAARAQAVNEVKIMHWFDQLKQVLMNANVLNMPEFIWNLDESGLQDVFQSKRAIGESGRQLYQVQAAEKGDTTTIVPVFNAVGTVASLMVIFKGVRLRPECCVGSPNNAVVKCSPDGWINKELFYELGASFVKYLKSQNYAPQQKHVLLLDGHGSHVYNVDFLKMMASNNVEVFCFPPHTSHILQPADVSVFKSLKTNWTTEGLKFTRETAGKKVGRQHFFQVFTPAWEKSSSVENIQAGFRKTGIFPFNQQAIPKCAFLPSLTTECRSGEPVAPVMPATAKVPKDATDDGVKIMHHKDMPAVSHITTQTLDGTPLIDQLDTQEGCMPAQEDLQDPLLITPVMPASVPDGTEGGVKIMHHKEKPAVSHSHICCQTLDDTPLNEQLNTLDIQEGCIQVQEEPLNASLLNGSVNFSEISIDVGCESMESLMIALQSLESSSTSTQNVGLCQQTESLDNYEVKASTPCHGLVEQSGHDSVQVEYDLSRPLDDVGLSSRSTAITSTRTENMSVAVNQNMTTGMRIPFTSLCSVPQREKSERKRKKPPSYRLTSEEHFDYITPQKEPKKQKTKMSCSKQKNKGQLTKQETCKKNADSCAQIKHPAQGAVKKSFSKQNGSRKKENKKEDDHTPCQFCKKQYNTPGDDKGDEEWLPCAGCLIWAHESCAEQNGIIGDSGNDFVCKGCCD